MGGGVRGARTEPVRKSWPDTPEVRQLTTSMAERIVVTLRSAVPADESAGNAYFCRALALKKRAEAHGATLCAWGGWTFSFGFAPVDVEEALEFAALVTEDAPEASGLAAAIAQGEMRSVGEGGSLAALSWGMPLVASLEMTRGARAGEVLLDAALQDLRSDEIRALGFSVVGDPPHRLVRRKLGTEHEQPPSGLQSFPSVPPRPSLAPPLLKLTDPLTELVKRALIHGDMEALERVTTQLRAAGARDGLVERMTGFVALGRGATAEALGRLRAAAEATTERAQQARARLAYGVALAMTGRADAALLEALDALARAREACDEHGEHACCLFLARLSGATGHVRAAAAWASTAARS